MKLKAAYLELDSIISANDPYMVRTDEAILNERSIEGLQLLQSYGYLLIIMSHPSLTTDGNFSHQQTAELKDKIFSICLKKGIYLDGFYWPHPALESNNGNNLACACRKTEPGLIIKAADEMNIDLSCSWVIGDILNDIETGNRAGCKTIMINDGNETEWVPGNHRIPEYFAKDLPDAARYIVADHNVATIERGISAMTDTIPAHVLTLDDQNVIKFNSAS